MAKWKKQAHVVYQCLYHVVWCPKYRLRILKGAVAKNIELMVEQLCEWKRAEIIELVVMEDHVHLVVVIPPRISVSVLMGILKGKTAIKLFKRYPEGTGVQALEEAEEYFRTECDKLGDIATRSKDPEARKHTEKRFSISLIGCVRSSRRLSHGPRRCAGSC